MAPRPVTPQSLPKYLRIIFQTKPPILMAKYPSFKYFTIEFPRSTHGKFTFLPLPPSDGKENVHLICRPKNKSTDLVNIPVLYKILAPLIAPTVSLLFNNSLSEGIFPECFKTVKIIHIFNLANLTVNYIPISMLHFLSKMFEKLMCARLESYLKSNNILYTNHFGFRKNLNTHSNDRHGGGSGSILACGACKSARDVGSNPV